MRRAASWTLALCVAALAGTAAVDSIRGALEPEPARAEPRPRPIEGLTLLSGRLVWMDERCRVHVTSLVTLQAVGKPRQASCRAGLSRAGRVTGPRAVRLVVPSPSGDHEARASRRGLRLVKDGRPVTLPVGPVRALAWSPDERWLAAAGHRQVYLVRVLSRDLRVRTIPVAATRLAWVAR